eukprot:4950972-Pyramimonas_sp.AAC.1
MALRAMLGQLPGKHLGSRPRAQLNGAQYQEVHAVATTGTTAGVRASYRRPSHNLSEEPRHAHAAP